MPVLWLPACYILVLLYAPISAACNRLMFEAHSGDRLRTWTLRLLTPLYLVATTSIVTSRPTTMWGLLMLALGIVIFLCDIPFCFGASAREETISDKRKPPPTVWYTPYILGRVLCFAQLIPLGVIVLGLLTFQ